MLVLLHNSSPHDSFDFFPQEEGGQGNAGAWEMKTLAWWQKPLSNGIKREQLRGRTAAAAEDFQRQEVKSTLFSILTWGMGTSRPR